MPHEDVPLKEFAARRRKLLTALKRSAALVFAGPAPSDHDTPFRPHPHFEYLTGLVDEPDAVLRLDPTHPVESRRVMLFLRPLNPEVEKWDGYRDAIGSDLRERLGIQSIFRLPMLGRFLNDSAQRTRSLACLHPLAQYDQPISPDLELYRKVAERVPGVSIEDRSDLLTDLRCVKSKAEIDQIQHAVDITADGFQNVLTNVRPGMREYEVQDLLEHTYRSHGSRRTAFQTIAGSGINSTVLHYRDNDGVVEDGDLICIDSGAVWNGYAADVTRTIPASGTFTDRQREVYELVLKAQEAAIKAITPGARMNEIDQAARAVITKAGYGDAFIHSIGHHLGLETHDPAPDAPLKAGAVLTIEPGVYLPDEAIGVRIEDDVVVTKQGCRNLSRNIPKTVREIEQAMKR